MSTITKNYRDSGIIEDFAPPPGPPPPIMPEGWVAKFDDLYQQFYYVNIATKQSQWDKPPGTIDLPARAPGELERPPSYDGRSTSTYNREGTTARPITPQQQPQSQQQHLQANQPSRSHSPRGITGRLSSFLKSHTPKPQTQQQQQQRYYAPQGYYQQQGRPFYGGSGYTQSGSRRPGMRVGGAAALGAGGGILGGMMLADAFDDHNGYEQGFEDGADFGGGFDGGDMGDFGGGDF